jgi:hypothetical protein
MLPKLKADLPPDITIDIANDNSLFIDRSVKNVYRTIAEAIVLVALVIFVFLRTARASIIPIVTIPVSLVGTFALMALFGFTINTLTLLALVLAIGLVVDDAIVMLENIFRHIEEGLDPFSAAIKGAREIGFATLGELGIAAAEELRPDIVYAGISFGVMAAQQLAQTRAGARGALFISACLPASEFGTWPSGVPVQVHGKDADEFFDEDLAAARALVDSTNDAELFLYPGEEHLFADASLPAYDAAATARVVERVLSYLAR